MEQPKATIKHVSPFQRDSLNLPISNLDAALPFYETVLGFQLISRASLPHSSAVLARDSVQIGLAENGGDSEQDGCFFEVDDVVAAFAELTSNGLGKAETGFTIQQHGDVNWKVFFVVAPDGLCYCYGQRQ